MALSTRSTSSDSNFFFYDRGAVSENLSTDFYGREPIVKQTLTTLLLMLFLAPLLGAQERVKFPVGVSSKVLGYGH